MTAWRLDTGPLVAALNRRDPDHSRCVAALTTFSGSLLTTGAVVAEAMYFLAGRPGANETRIGFLDDAQWTSAMASLHSNSTPPRD